jgi:hypothetical protein
VALGVAHLPPGAAGSAVTREQALRGVLLPGVGEPLAVQVAG